MDLNFRSDNESPAAPEILQALISANEGSAYSYAEDQWSERLDAAFSELFETTTVVIPLCTGTAANAIALAALSRPWGAVYCHRNAHVYNDESGAPEFFGNGLRLIPVEGPNGKFDAGALEASIRKNTGHGVHSYVPTALTLTQSTESGTVYRPDEIRNLCGAAEAHGMGRHMDGARFANAVEQLGCHPADLTWKAGVQLLSFGASKNGCTGAEALLLFDRHDLKETAERLRKRSGHLLSKMRYVSAQLLAYIEGGRWLELAHNANFLAAHFARAVDEHPEARLEYTVEANEVFVRWSPEGFRRLEDAGIGFLTWPGQDDLARFVFSHNTTMAATETLCHALAG